MMLAKTVTNEECIEAIWKTGENIPLRCNFVPERTKMQTEMENKNPEVKFPAEGDFLPDQRSALRVFKWRLLLSLGIFVRTESIARSDALVKRSMWTYFVFCCFLSHRRICPIEVQVQALDGSQGFTERQQRLPMRRSSGTPNSVLVITAHGETLRLGWRSTVIRFFLSRPRGCRGYFCEYSRWKPSRW